MLERLNDALTCTVHDAGAATGHDGHGRAVDAVAGLTQDRFLDLGAAVAHLDADRQPPLVLGVRAGDEDADGDVRAEAQALDALEGLLGHCALTHAPDEHEPARHGHLGAQLQLLLQVWQGRRQAHAAGNDQHGGEGLDGARDAVGPLEHARHLDGGARGDALQQGAGHALAGVDQEGQFGLQRHALHRRGDDDVFAAWRLQGVGGGGSGGVIALALAPLVGATLLIAAGLGRAWRGFLQGDPHLLGRLGQVRAGGPPAGGRERVALPEAPAVGDIDEVVGAGREADVLDGRIDGQAQRGGADALNFGRMPALEVEDGQSDEAENAVQHPDGHACPYIDVVWVC